MAFAGGGVQPGSLGQRQEELAVALQAHDAFGLGLDHPQRGQCCRGQWRREADGVHHARRLILQDVDQLLLARYVAAARGQRLAQRAHPDVDRIGIDAEMLRTAMSLGTEDAESMRLVDHQPRIVLLFQLDERRQVGGVPVHRVQSLDNDQRTLVQMAIGREDTLQRFGIVVAERVHRRA